MDSATSKESGSMEYLFFILCVLLFVLFGFYIMYKIDTFLTSGDFRSYTDEDMVSYKKTHSKRKKK